MIEYLIVIIPTAIAFCFVATSMWKSEERLSLILLLAALLCFWTHCFALSFWWFEDTVMPMWIDKTSAITTCLFMPFAYLFVCSNVNVKLFSISTVILLAMILINIVDSGAIYFDLEPANEVMLKGQIGFYKNGNAIFHIYIFEFVLFLQSIWILARAVTWAQSLREKGMRLSRVTKEGITIISVLTLMTIISTLLPIGIWSSDIARYIYMLCYAVFITYGLLFLTTKRTGNAILDSNNEPIYFNKKPKFEKLARKCHKLFNEDKVFRTPNLKLEDVAHMLGTNRTYAAEMIKSYFHNTFAAYTNALRVEEAKRIMLEHPTEKMEDIAKECGFSTAPTFTKAFKASTGITPSAWLAITRQHEQKFSS